MPDIALENPPPAVREASPMRAGGYASDRPIKLQLDFLQTPGAGPELVKLQLTAAPNTLAATATNRTVLRQGYETTDVGATFKHAVGVRAFCILFLTKFAPNSGIERLAGIVAETLCEQLHRIAPRESESWLRIMFPEYFARENGNRQLFTYKTRKDANLGFLWDIATLTVTLDDQEVSPNAYLDLALEILIDYILAKLVRGKDADGAEVHLLRIKIRGAIENQSPEASAQSIQERLKELVGSPTNLGLLLRNLTEGCMEIWMEVRSDELRRLLRESMLESLTDDELKALLSDSDSFFMDELLMPDPCEFEPGSAAPSSATIAFVEQASGAEAFRRPWRRLWWLCHRRVRGRSWADVIAQSAHRSYSAPRLLGNQAGSLRADLTSTLLAWPLLVAVLVTFLAATAQLLGLPASITSGALIGALMTIYGAQPCSIAISPLACGAGGILLGTAFGLVNSIVLGAFPDTHRLGLLTSADPFTAVTGGAIGLTAPNWPTVFSTPTIVALLATVAAGIAGSAWMMGQPGRASGAPLAAPWTTDLRGAVVGSAASAAIGGILGLTHAMSGFGLPPQFAFALAFGLVSSTAVAAIVWIRTRSRRTTANFSVVNALATLTLTAAVFGFAGTNAGPFTLAVANAWYHSVFFTLAFVIGERLSTVRGGVLAALLEGVGGFVGFILFRMYQA